MAGSADDEGAVQMTGLLQECDEEAREAAQLEECEGRLPLSLRLAGLARRRRRLFAAAGAGTVGLVVLATALLSQPQPAGRLTAQVGAATQEHEGTASDDDHHHAVSKELAAKAKAKAAANEAWVYRNAIKGQPWPSLFCWSHIEEWGSERTLMASQLEKKFGIFACNDFAVISRSKHSIVLGPHPKNSSLMVKTWINSLPPDRKGNPAAGDTTSSYVNAKTFLVAWKTLMKSKVLWSHDWIVKCDPDAVFYPERLRWHVEKFTKPPSGPGPFYLMNCNKDGGRIYGALEVYSYLAIKEMDERGSECEAMPLDKWGEDLYMELCMKHLNGVKNGLPDYQLVGDDRCTQAPCSPGYRAAFHPYPNAGAFWGCAAAAGR